VCRLPGLTGRPEAYQLTYQTREAIMGWIPSLHRNPLGIAEREVLA
jgi:hypothetical protein